eukprot:TRINITY_DN63616_c1_g1_i1.p1 TRINITY_DN63616_c1_g1~~TRINITY_DN63616_c1_g1_i1.p1  ORF type:complete len:144 (+),score=18.33 TRINITY_DN63616_c1_g1_i1:41-472(+)
MKAEGTATPTGSVAAGNLLELRRKKISELGWSPGKNLGMQAFLMWMAGSEIHIFSIMIVSMGFFNSISAIMGTNQAFAKLDTVPELAMEVQLHKLLYIALNLVGLGIAMVKCYWMGLLPTAAADWVNSTPRMAVEFSSAGFFG